MISTRSSLVVIAAFLLSSCGSPFAGNVNEINWAGKTAAGTITVSDPKLFRSEALIEQRRKRAAWIQKLITASETETFEPEILREIEIIQAFSAALGLSFDPAAGANFTRDNEAAQIEQEIRLMRLQLQLDQLRRDAELVRAGFTEQTDPVNADIAALGEAGNPETLSGPQVAAAVSKLNDTITALQSRLDAETRPPQGVGAVKANPLDQFRDRSALRDTLENELSSISLDELHDQGTATLVRLTFQATVIPDVDRLDAPGVVQMRVLPSTEDEIDFFLRWLSSENSRQVLPDSDAKAKADDAEQNVWIDQLARRGVRARPYYFGPNAACPGFLSVALAPPPTPTSLTQLNQTCRLRSVLIPEVTGFNKASEPMTPLLDVAAFKLKFRRNNWGDIADHFISNLISRKDEIVEVDDAKKCTLRAWYANRAGLEFANTQGDIRGLAEYIYDQQTLLMTRSFIRDLQAYFRSNAATAPQADPGKLEERASSAAQFMQAFEQRIISGCTNADELRDKIAGLAPEIVIPNGVRRAMDADNRNVFIYEVGPRSEVQQVGTNARAANSLGLALAVAASGPSSGTAANLNSAYQRQATGKVQARERVPAVTGYAVGSQDTFGWVLGPRAQLDPKGRLDIAHALRPYDLRVDLSIPAWWRELELETITAWSPKITNIAGGALQSEEELAPTRFSVRLPYHNDAMDLFSRQLVGAQYLGGGRTADLERSATGQSVSACKTTVVQFTGRYLWRTSTVIIGGHRIRGNDGIQIMPNMRGINVTVPGLEKLIEAPANGGNLPVTLQTPYNPVSTSIAYKPAPDGGCKSPPKTQPLAKAVIGLPSPLRIPTKPSDVQNVLVTVTMSGSMQAVKTIKFNGATIGAPDWKDTSGYTEFEFSIPKQRLQNLANGPATILLLGDKKDGKDQVLRSATVTIERN